MSHEVIENERISCGCCRGPENDRCCCWIHQDTPRGLRPHVCTRHAHLASATQPKMQELADRTTQEGLGFVRARKIVESLWKNGENYHAGAINHEAFDIRNRELWLDAERLGLETEVKRQLRNAR